MRAVFRAVARALAALAAAALVLVMEGGRLVWRALRALAGAPEPSVEEAEAAADVALPEQAAVPAPSPDAEWGHAAVAHMIGEPGADRVLDEPALAYLDGLDDEQRGRLAGYPASMIGRHLRASRLIPSLPPAPTLSEWRSAQARTLAESGRAAERRLTAREEADRIREEVFQDLLGDDYVPPSLAA